MSYEAWRISFQSSEQAARAAYEQCASLQLKMAETVRRNLELIHELGALKSANTELSKRLKDLVAPL